MTDYRVAVHESPHAVTASVLDVGWHVVSVNAHNGTAGRLTPDRAYFDAMFENNWPAEAFAITCIAGPLAEGQWMGENLERVREIDWEPYGSTEDFAVARIIAETTGARFNSLLRSAADFLDDDKIKLAVERVADALVERHTLTPTGVNKLVYGRVRGAGS
jgi:hypothetical protein